MKHVYFALNWVFGVLFLLVGLVLIIEFPLGGLSLVLISLLLLPPVRNFVYSKTNKELPVKVRGIAISVLFIAFSVFVVQSYDRKAQELVAKEAKEKAQNAAVLQQQNIDYFNQNSSQILSEIKMSFQKGNYKEVVSLSSKYLPSQNQELIELNSKAKSELATIEKAEKVAKEKADRESKTKEILARLKAIPASKYKQNRNLYQQLVTNNPDNEKYKEKLNFYSAKIKEQQEKEHIEQEKLAQEREAKKVIAKPVSEPISSISFTEIRRNMKGMTDLQFEEYVKTLIGKRIRWGGYVEDVKEKFFGGYEVLVDMDSPNDLISVQDVTFEVSKEQALSFNKDSRIKFEGTISSVLDILTSLQISLDKVKVIRSSEFLSVVANSKLRVLNELIRFNEGTIIVYNYRILKGTSESYQVTSDTYIKMPSTGDYLILDISIENFSSKTVEINPFLENLVVYDEKGRKYPDSSVDAAFDAIEKDENIDEIPPGEKRRGEFAFKLPKGKEATLYYKPIVSVFGFGKENIPVKIKIY